VAETTEHETVLLSM